MNLAKGAVRTMFVNKVLTTGVAAAARGRDDRDRRGCVRLSGRQARSGYRATGEVAKRERTGCHQFR